MSRTRVRAQRKLQAGAYLRLFEYMDRRDKAYVECVITAAHIRSVQRLEVPSGVMTAIRAVLARLGLAGVVLRAILGALEQLRPSILDECDRIIRRGPTPNE